MAGMFKWMFRQPLKLVGVSSDLIRRKKIDASAATSEAAQPIQPAPAPTYEPNAEPLPAVPPSVTPEVPPLPQHSPAAPISQTPVPETPYFAEQPFVPTQPVVPPNLVRDPLRRLEDCWMQIPKTLLCKGTFRSPMMKLGVSTLNRIIWLWFFECFEASIMVSGVWPKPIPIPLPTSGISLFVMRISAKFRIPLEIAKRRLRLTRKVSPL